MRFITALLALLTLSLFPIAAAQASEAAAGASSTTVSSSDARAEASSPAEKKEERRICKREQVTGSNLPARKICLTARGWKNRQSGI